MARGIGPTARTNSVKNALRHCSGDPCECLAEAIDRLLNGHQVPGQRPNKGIMDRIRSMLAPGADPPGTMFNGKDTWATHTTQLQQRRSALDNLMQEYDAQGCGGGGGSAVAVDRDAVHEALNTPIPTPDDFWDLYPDQRPATDSGPNGFWRGAALVGAGVLGVVTVGAALFPFDGPLGEAAAGTGTLALWGFATQ